MRRHLLLPAAIALTSTVAFAQSPPAAVAFAAQPLPADFPTPIAADFNGDGKLDIAATNGNQILVSLGNGDGTFQTPSVYNETCATSALFAGDANGDGKLDIIAVVDGACFQPFPGEYFPGIYVLLGNGDGTFQTALQSPVYQIEGITASAVGDFNGDGKLDVALLTFGGLSPGLVLFGNDEGTFTINNKTSFSTGFPEGGYGPMVALDVNGDGKLDLMSANGGSTDTISVMLGTGGGGFQAPVISMGSFTAAAIADYNGDGIPDVAYVPNMADTIYILLGNADGTFGTPISVSVKSFSGFDPVACDFNGDGKIDLQATIYVTNKAGELNAEYYDSLTTLLKTMIDPNTPPAVRVRAADCVLARGNQGFVR